MAEATAGIALNDGTPARRRSDLGRHEARGARDRLISMLVLAALLHGLVLLGITFGPSRDSSPGSAGLEVLLVSNELPEARHNDAATYLSQRTQQGSGNTDKRLDARAPGAPAAGGAIEELPRGTSSEEPDDALLTSSAPRARVRFSPPPPLPDTDPSRAREEEDQTLPPGAGAAPVPVGEGDSPLTLRGKRRDELEVTADTRASSLAPYLDGWRRRVERIGTINYPSAAQRMGLQGHPVVEVAIQRDGRLLSASIRRSSGHAEIDAAALAILRLASPFDPFPPELSKEYRVLRFAYEWQFVGGRVGSGTLSVP